jgi:Tol biopolymer transport system component
VTPDTLAAGRDVSRDEVRAELSAVLRSPSFANAPSLSRLLSHIVDRTLEGKSEELKEYSLGVDVFDRGETFDPKIDTIVRVQARRLRSKLDEYYESDGRAAPVVIELAKGRYVPGFRRSVPEPPPSQALFVHADQPPVMPVDRAWMRYVRGAIGAVALLALALSIARMVDSRSRLVASAAEYEQLTDFTDSATAPALSPDGRVLAFIRGGEPFLSHGQIYVKVLPSGDAVRLTTNGNRKFAPVFSPDGSRVAYSELSRTGAVNSWDTFTAPVIGGEPSRLLPNATGLVWLDPLHVMFSEFKGTPGHLGIVTSTAARADERAVYFPEHDRAMAHYSYLSPDRSAVLIVEMDRTGTFQSCRVVPFDGGSMGHFVGPDGHCRSAGWSPDGRWMYFGAEVDGHSHLWRQAYPSGAPEQITFGPSEEEGVAVAPDGRSLITSIGRRQSTLWIHDGAGERVLSSEGFASAPRMSRDGRRVYYLVRESPDSASSDLRSIDLASRKVERLLPGMPIAENDVFASNYDISRDEREVVFATKQPDGGSTIWLAPVDRHTPPRALAHDGAWPSFGAHDDVFFVTLGKAVSVFARIAKDGTGRERASDRSPVHNRGGISPDGEWAVLYSPGSPDDPLSGTAAVPLHGGRARRICSGLCWAWWSDDARFLYVSVFDESAPESTLVIPLAPGVLVPDFPETGMNVPANQHAIPGTRIIERGNVALAPNPSTYVFVKAELQRNLYRIPLH